MYILWYTSVIFILAAVILDLFLAFIAQVSLPSGEGGLLQI
jgi:hypothetical protein